jgi:hypothetical protein
MSRDAISNLIYRYCRALDRLDMALLRRCFHEDADVNMGAIYRGGPDGFVEVAQGFMGSMTATRHVVGNILIANAGPEQGIEAYVDAWHRLDTPDGPRELMVRARYLQRAAERGGEWRFTHHSEVIDFGEMRVVDTGWFDGNAELEKGTRGEADASAWLFK